MSLADLVARSRSYRRFHEHDPVPLETLRALVALARLAPSGGNQQPLRFLLSADTGRNAAIFPHLTFAGRLRWTGPAPGERPAAYVVVLGDQRVKSPSGFAFDAGVAAQTILLGAAERGLGGVIVGGVQRAALGRSLGLGEHLELVLVLALGRPREEVVLEPLPASGDTAYWRDEAGRHHVPKRSLDELIVAAGEGA
jgi:nitroreductase